MATTSSDALEGNQHYLSWLIPAAGECNALGVVEKGELGWDPDDLQTEPLRSRCYLSLVLIMLFPVSLTQ